MGMDFRKEQPEVPGPCHTPNDLLLEERKALEPLTETADSYGLLHLLRVYPESVVRFETNCYSVPESLIGQVTSNELRIYHDNQSVAQHQRSYQKRQKVRDLEPFPVNPEPK